MYTGNEEFDKQNQAHPPAARVRLEQMFIRRMIALRDKFDPGLRRTGGQLRQRVHRYRLYHRLVFWTRSNRRYLHSTPVCHRRRAYLLAKVVNNRVHQYSHWY